MRNISGRDNPRWNGGSSQYPNHALLKKRRIQVLMRANGVCEICGERARTVHHIDNSKSNHDLSNLLALCHPCHKTIHEEFGKSTSKYIRKYGFTLADMAKILGCSICTVRNWAEQDEDRVLRELNRIKSEAG